MREINNIIIHCSATAEGRDFRADDIKRMHLQRGYRDIGYHYVVDLDGTIEKGRPIEEIGAHCKGYNKHSIGVCYIGGVDTTGKAKDTRTQAQKEALIKLLTEIKREWPNAKIAGHRDFSEDKNGNGKIDPWERMKECPCFDAIPEYTYI